MTGLDSTRSIGSARRKLGLLGVALALVVLSGCAAERPVLYSGASARPPGAAGAISACEDQARAAGLDYAHGRLGGSARAAAENGAVGGAGGAVAGAIYGDAARGAAAGAAGGIAAGLIRGLFAAHDRGPAPAYRAYVDRCLRDRGYDPIAWN